MASAVAGMAISAQVSGLLPITQHAMMCHNGIAFHEYESFAIRADERERIAADLGEKHIMMLRNHTAGPVPLLMPQRVAAETTARRLRSMTQEHYAIFFESCLAMLASDAGDWRA
jgi:hypothetical protein